MKREKPVRLQLSRQRGFNLQALSVATNGLEAVKVDRTTKWGNPFKVGQRNPCGTITQDKRHSFLLFVGFAPLIEELVTAARAELRGKNLACWCAYDPYQDICHATVLLKIANEPRTPTPDEDDSR